MRGKEDSYREVETLAKILYNAIKQNDINVEEIIIDTISEISFSSKKFYLRHDKHYINYLAKKVQYDNLKLPESFYFVK